jgi:hypothetical protein
LATPVFHAGADNALPKRRRVEITFSGPRWTRGCSLPRKTDSNNPFDWIAFSESDLEGVRLLAEREVSYTRCHSKLAEVLEKVLKVVKSRLSAAPP